MDKDIKDKRCNFHTGEWDHYGFMDGTGGYTLCNRQAKFEDPSPQNESQRFVCGIHARVINKHYELIESPLRCIKLK